jgi:hypothetical protein
MRKLAFSLVMATAMLAGCGEKVYHGQAFIKTSESTIKLSDLEIKVIALSSLEKNIPNFKENLSKLAFESENRVKSINSHLSELETLKSVAKILVGNEDVLKPLEPSGMKALLEELARLEEIKITKVNDVNQTIESLQTALNPSIYFLPTYASELVRTRTDADGRFKLNFDGKTPAAVVANSDSRYWFVNLPKPSGEPLYLTEANQHDSPSCISCFFKGDSSKTVVAAVAMHAKSVVDEVKTVTISDAAADKKDSLYTQALALASKHKMILTTIGELPVTKALSAGLTGERRARQAYAIQRTEIELELSILQAQEKHRQLTRATLERASELKKRLIAI